MPVGMFDLNDDANLTPIWIQKQPEKLETVLEAIWDNGGRTEFIWEAGKPTLHMGNAASQPADHAFLRSGRVYAFNFADLRRPVPLQKNLEMQPSGLGLALSLTNLQDQWPERFDALNDDLRRAGSLNPTILDTTDQGLRNHAQNGIGRS